MKPLILLLPVILLTACKEPPAEVEVSQTRPLTTKDEAPQLNATSAERFLPADVRAQIDAQGGLDTEGGAGAWTYRLPAGWKEAPAKAMRDVNLTFGPDDSGEVYLSVVGGGVKPNADRWFRQFGSEPQALADLGKVPFLEGEAYLVTTEGRYEPGMGRPGKDGQGLLGVLLEKEGRLYTVKMIGDAAEVSSRREEFLTFIASLKSSD